MVVIGEKGRAQLVRDRKDAIIATIQEVGKVRMTFAQVSALHHEVLLAFLTQYFCLLSYAVHSVTGTLETCVFCRWQRTRPGVHSPPREPLTVHHRPFPLGLGDSRNTKGSSRSCAAKRVFHTTKR